MTIRANRKVDEARYFLGEMARLDGQTSLDRPEVFGYNLSAFLSAALSVEYSLGREVQSAALKAERAAWLTSLPLDVQTTIAFFETTRHAGRMSRA